MESSATSTKEEVLKLYRVESCNDKTHLDQKPYTINGVTLPCCGGNCRTCKEHALDVMHKKLMQFAKRIDDYKATIASQNKEIGELQREINYRELSQKNKNSQNGDSVDDIRNVMGKILVPGIPSIWETYTTKRGNIDDICADYLKSLQDNPFKIAMLNHYFGNENAKLIFHKQVLLAIQFCTANSPNMNVYKKNSINSWTKKEFELIQNSQNLQKTNSQKK